MMIFQYGLLAGVPCHCTTRGAPASLPAQLNVTCGQNCKQKDRRLLMIFVCSPQARQSVGRISMRTFVSTLILPPSSRQGKARACQREIDSIIEAGLARPSIVAARCKLGSAVAMLLPKRARYTWRFSMTRCT